MDENKCFLSGIIHFLSPIINYLFLARSWHGAGGMQRLNRDFAREGEGAYGERFRCLHPRRRGPFSLAFFILRALRQGGRIGKAGGRVHLSDASLLPLGMLLRCLGCRSISATVCGRDLLWPARWYQWLLCHSFFCIDRFVCISRATADALAARGIDWANIIVIPPGIGIENVPSSSLLTAHRSPLTAPMLLSVGRLVPRKGHAWFLEHVFPLILRRYPDARYALIGFGPEEARIRTLIRRIGLERHVELRGFCADEECDRAFLQANVFLMPNVPVAGDMEGFGIVCLEAASKGVPVVAARCEGIVDAVIEGETGCFFPPLDAAACAEAVFRMIEQPPPREHIMEYVRERYGWPRIFSLYRQHVFD